MRRAITLTDARRMLRARHDLLEGGMTERKLRAGLAGGAMRRIWRGWYVAESQWQSLWPEGRHLLEVVAADRSSIAGIVAAGVSAAVLQGMPLYRHSPDRVHVVAPGRSRSSPGIMRHEVTLDDEDIVTRGGIRCTSLERTVIDVARTTAVETGIACADAALRMMAVTGQQQDEERATAWRAQLLERSAASRERGIRQARRIIAFSDGRAQLPGESVSRFRLWQLGFRRLELQVPVPGPTGSPYWVDFAMEDAGALGEFDGEGKYLDPALLGSRTTQQALLEEKQREDWIRGVTQRPFARWADEHIATPNALGTRLAAFGIRPPEH